MPDSISWMKGSGIQDNDRSSVKQVFTINVCGRETMDAKCVIIPFDGSF